MTETCLDHNHGDTFTLPLLFLDYLDVPVNLTGSSIMFSIKKNKTDTTYSAQASAVIDVGAGWTATITIKPLSIALGDYWYDVQWIDSAGNIQTVMKGQFSVTYDITT
jgi:gentisate 1,2-dioxygenase